MTRVAINGFGRIGRAFLRAAWHDPEVEVVAINDLGDLDNLAYLLKYDTVYRQFPGQVFAEGGELVVGAKRIKIFQEKEPAKLPWKDLQIDVVVESTGFFTEYAKAKLHADAGARKVVISAPPKGDAVPGCAVVLVGINEEKLANCPITSNGSCTTNAASPVVAIIEETLDIEKALLDTIHSYTASQSIVDSPNKKNRREGRRPRKTLCRPRPARQPRLPRRSPACRFLTGYRYGCRPSPAPTSTSPLSPKKIPPARRSTTFYAKPPQARAGRGYLR